jgi:hypothetical protein
MEAQRNGCGERNIDDALAFWKHPLELESLQ